MNNRTILMIDDEADIQTVARIGLSMTSSWQVTVANSGKAGIAEAQQQKPDAILLDLMMPDMDGIATLKALKGDQRTQHIPVVFLTAKSQAVARKQFYELGAQGVIHKPFDPMTLAGQVAGFLGWQL